MKLQNGQGQNCLGLEKREGRDIWGQGMDILETGGFEYKGPGRCHGEENERAGSTYGRG